MNAISSLAERLDMPIRPHQAPVLTVVPDVVTPGPRTLRDVVGQDELRVRLNMRLEATVLGGFDLPNVLLTGPAGCGKSSFAKVIAAETGMTLRATTATACRGRGLAILLGDLEPNTLVFIDEIHDMPRRDQEALGIAMIDGKLYLPAKGAEPPIERDVEKFTLVAATTLPGLLSKPLLDRFGFRGALTYYSTAELAEIITAKAEALGVELGDGAAATLASRSRGTPRVAGNLLTALRAYVTVMSSEVATVVDVEAALEIEGIDTLGCDADDRTYLEALTTLVTDRAGSPCGLAPLATCCGLDRKLIEHVIEPFMIHSGLLRMTDRGRVATRLAFEHLERRVPIFIT